MPKWRLCGGVRVIGRPSSTISPAVGDSNPASIMSAVVLPAPEGPSKRQELAAPNVQIEVAHDEVHAVVGLLHAAKAHQRLGLRFGQDRARGDRRPRGQHLRTASNLPARVGGPINALARQRGVHADVDPPSRLWLTRLAHGKLKLPV